MSAQRCGAKRELITPSPGFLQAAEGKSSGSSNKRRRVASVGQMKRPWDWNHGAVSTSSEKRRFIAPSQGSTWSGGSGSTSRCSSKSSTNSSCQQSESDVENWPELEDYWSSFEEMQLYTRLTNTSTSSLVIKLPGHSLANLPTPGNHGRHQLDLGPMRVRVFGSAESLGGAGDGRTWVPAEGKDLIWDCDHWRSSLLPVPANTLVEFRVGKIQQKNAKDHAPGLQSGWDRGTNHENRQWLWSGLCRFETAAAGEVLEVTLPEHVAQKLFQGDHCAYYEEVYTKKHRGTHMSVHPVQERLVEGWQLRARGSWQQQALLPEAGKQRTFTFRGGKPGSKLTFNTNLYLPPGFDQAKGKRWPLLVFLHSQHSRLDGDMNLFYESYSPTRLVLGDEKCPEALRKNFIVLAPQNLTSRERGDRYGDGIWLRRGAFTEGTSFDEEAEAALRDLIDSVVDGLPIDRQRISVAGTSMGGHGALQIASRWPGYFAACVPVAAHFEFEPLENVAKRLALKALPMWFFHAKNDTICRYNNMQALCKKIRRHSWAEVHFTTYSDTWSYSGHCADRVPFWKSAMWMDARRGAGKKTWERRWCYGDDLFGWLLRQRGPGARPETLTKDIVESGEFVWQAQ